MMNNDDKVLMVTVGLPKSGKSTWVDGFLKRDPDYQVVCADDIRLGMGFQFDRKMENFVWGVHDAMLLASLERGLCVIVDGTNTTLASLIKYEKYATEYGYTFRIIFFDTHEDVCLKRNEGKHVVPENVILRMSGQFYRLKNSNQWRQWKHNNIYTVP